MVDLYHRALVGSHQWERFQSGLKAQCAAPP